MTRYLYALVPLLVLFGAISLACVVGYLAISGFDSDIPLRKIIRKATQLFLLLSIIPAMYWLKLNKQGLGFAPKPAFFKQLRLGFALGIATLLPMFVLLYALDVNVIDVTQPWTWQWLGKKLFFEFLLAALVGFFEEPVFRGILLAGLMRKLPVLPSVVISAFYYAVLHFLDSKTPIPKQDLGLSSGFKLLAEACGNVLNPDILSSVSSLFMVGLFLGLLRTRISLGLGVCIGCHAAWVWQIKLNKVLLNTDYGSAYAYLVSQHDGGVIGPLVTVWLAIVIVIRETRR